MPTACAEIIVKRGIEITAYELTGETMGGTANAWAPPIGSQTVRSSMCQTDGMKKRTVGLLLTLCLLSAPAAAQEVRLSYLFSDGNLPGVLQAYKILLAEHPDLADRVSVTFLTESMFNDVTVDEMTSTDVLVFDIMNQQMLERFNTTHGVDLITAVSGRGLVYAVGQGLMPRDSYISQGAVWDERARAFWTNWGLGNQIGLMKQALSAAGVAGLTVPDPELSVEAGYYYPDGDIGRVFDSWDGFDEWRQANGKHRPGALRVAIGFYKSNYYAGDTALLDAVIAEVERQGGEAIPMFGYPSGTAFEELLLDENDDARADTALAFVFRFADFEASKSLERLNIPVVNLVSLYGRSEAEWRESAMGLTMLRERSKWRFQSWLGWLPRRLSEARSASWMPRPGSRSSPGSRFLSA